MVEGKKEKSGSNQDIAGSNEDIVLHATGLDLFRGARRVVRLDELKLRRSSVTAVLGPNGCGKSTLLKALAGFLVPKSGLILIQGRELYHGRRCDPVVRKSAVLVHQRPVVFDRSVLGNVAYGLLRRGSSRAEARSTARAALEEAGLAHLTGRPARELSGGERRRMALVRALLLKPSVLFLDEPSAEVDEASMKWLTPALREAASDRAVLLATHDADLARNLADHVVGL